MNQTKVLTKDFLIQEHLNKEQSPIEISKKVGCSSTVVYNYLNKFNIKVIDWYSEKINRVLTKGYLEEEYIRKELPIWKISENTNYDFWTIQNRLIKFNFKIRNKSEACSLPYGSKYVNRDGYILIKIERRGWILEHRYVIEYMFKRKLKRNETVFHLNNIRNDNRINNLKVFDSNTVSLYLLIKRFQEYYRWRRSVLRRDSHICQECGSEQNLEVHHIKAFICIFNEFLDIYIHLNSLRDKEMLLNLAKNYRPFWELANGKTLCFKCHNLVENRKFKNENL